MGWERRTDKKWKWKNPFVCQIQFSGNDSVMLGWKATGVRCSWSRHHQAEQWKEVDRKAIGVEVQTLSGGGGNKSRSWGRKCHNPQLCDWMTGLLRVVIRWIRGWLLHPKKRGFLWLYQSDRSLVLGQLPFLFKQPMSAERWTSKSYL